MKFKKISHRGNLNGQNIETENSPLQIKKVINIGYDCEIDVWLINKKFYLGHNEPKYLIKEKFLENNKLWCHAKNIEAFLKMLKNNKIHCFWHENDAIALTSKGVMWAFPGKQPIKNSIAVLPELNNDDTSECLGVCSDFIEKYQK